ncbi:LacI family DNA-binding transcriptional regulator [Streptomyces sp. DT224]|uniref:LacI family DNA-binding transcriptional regulator n=1 Tax=Streptomyces sp. DT224 TaxID=3393426 RepID=UPI003CF7F5C6
MTLSDVARDAGVSPATASRVLSGRYSVPDATRARVERSVRKLGYVANMHARVLAGALSRIVAVLTSDVTSAFYGRIVEGIEQEAVAAGRMCILVTTQNDPGRESAMLSLLREQNAEVVVLVGGVDAENEAYRNRMAELARTLDAAGSRLVLIGRPSPSPDAPVTVVEYDAVGGALAITSHLLSMGHQRVLFLGGTPGSTTTSARVEGYRKALAGFGIEADPELVVHGRSTRNFGYETITRLLDAGRPDFTAVFACDDLVAAGAMTALRERGLDVPGDFSVAGYDDLPQSVDLVPPLTTVNVPLAQLGRAAVQLALRRTEDAAAGQHVMLGTHVVVRHSVRPRFAPRG